MCKGKQWFWASLLSVLISMLIGSGEQVQSQEKYPTRAIEIIVPFSAGGGTDLISRFTATFVNKKWGVPVNVVNKPGGNGIPATLEIYKAAPDGYAMLGDSQATSSILAAAVKDLPFKIMDRTYIATTGIFPYILFVPSTSPFKSLEDLMAEAKKNPGNISYTSLPGGGLEVAVRQFFNAIGVDISKARPVMTRGGSEAVTLTAGGHVTLGSSSVSSVLPAVKGGTVRPLLITSKNRYPDLPDVPTSTEMGFPRINCTTWIGISGPPKLPSHIIDMWGKTMEELVKDPGFLSQLKNIGAMPFYLNSQGTIEYVKKDIEEVSKLY